MESKVGFHIIKITDKRAARLLELGDPVLPGEQLTVRDQIMRLLQYEKQRSQYADLFEKEVKLLRKQADIRIFEKNLE